VAVYWFTQILPSATIVTVSVSISVPSVSVIMIIGVDFVANDTTHYSPADCSNSTAISQDVTYDATETSPDRRILVLS
jgi:hypothetical protein